MTNECACEYEDGGFTALCAAHQAVVMDERDKCVMLAKQACIDVGCTADEATTVVRRTREAIANAIQNTPKR